MKNKILLMFGLLILTFNLAAFEIKVDNAIIKSTKPGQTVTAGFMKINSSSTINIKKIYAEIAGRVEVHTMKMEKGPYGNSIMKMRKIDNPVIFANKEFILEPGADHLMIYDIKKQLKSKDNLTLTFIFLDENKNEFKKNIKFKVY